MLSLMCWGCVAIYLDGYCDIRLRVIFFFFFCIFFFFFFLSFFFFQAEDGIRDIGVTGVQTCALPISQLKIFATCFRHGRFADLRHKFADLNHQLAGCLESINDK